MSDRDEIIQQLENLLSDDNIKKATTATVDDINADPTNENFAKCIMAIIPMYNNAMNFVDHPLSYIEVMKGTTKHYGFTIDSTAVDVDSKNAHLSPTVYTNEAYEAYVEYAQELDDQIDDDDEKKESQIRMLAYATFAMCNMIYSAVMESLKAQKTIESIMMYVSNKELMLEHVLPCVENYERNKEEYAERDFVFMKMPNHPELAVRYIVSDNNNPYCVKLTHEHIKHLNVTIDELHDHSIKNMEYDVKKNNGLALTPLTKLLTRMNPMFMQFMPPEIMTSPLHAVTAKNFRSPAILLSKNIMLRISNKLNNPKKIYIIPSSTLELIVIPCYTDEDCQTAENDIPNVVKEVNNDVLDKEDPNIILSNKAMVYNPHNGDLKYI